MTREKEIEQAMKDSVAETIYVSGYGMTLQATDLLECAFTKGAEWADEHPDSKSVYTKQQLLDMGFAFTTNGDIVTPEQSNEDLKKYLQYQKQKFVKKACEWLDNNKDNYIIDIEGETLIDDKIIEDFRKAMEE